MPSKKIGTTQKEKVLKYLKTGKVLTPSYALNNFDCWRLADVIYKLRKDYEITTTIPKGKVHGEYRLIIQ